MIRGLLVTSPLGLLTLTEEDGALTGLFMEKQKYFPKDLPQVWEKTAVLAQAEDWLARYFAGERTENPAFPLHPKGSQFQKQAWELLRRIPYGQTTTYAAIAAQIARSRGVPRMSAQAVGSAVGHNPISILIPCHRVLGSDGRLTGYAGGLKRKQWLLEWERDRR